jgi:small subunit ribosomal protein S8
MVTDRIGDFIIRLQNAARIGATQVSAPYSGHILDVAKKLVMLGFLTGADVRSVGESEVKKEIFVTLAYEDGRPRLRGVKRVSKPGRRLYVPYEETHKVKGGTGSRVISSPKGIISDTEARRDRVGGEALFEIW